MPNQIRRLAWLFRGMADLIEVVRDDVESQRG